MKKYTRVSYTVARPIPVARRLRVPCLNLKMMSASGARARIIPGTYVRAKIPAASPKTKMLIVSPTAEPISVDQKLMRRENNTASVM